MKVVHIATSDTGGAAMGMLNQHFALLEAGVDSRILVAQKSTFIDSITEVAPNMNFLDWSGNRIVRKVQKELRKRNKLLNCYENVRREIEQLNDNHPVLFTSPITQYDLSDHPLVQESDIINLHWVSDFLDVESFFSKIQKPIVWTMRDENPGLGGFHYVSNKESNYVFYKHLEDRFIEIKRKAVLGCEKLSFVSLSDVMVEYCSSHEFLSEKRNEKIYNAINPSEFELVDRSLAKVALGLNSDDIIITFVSVTLDDNRKGLSQLLDAVHYLDNKKIKILCVGATGKLMMGDSIIPLGCISNNRLMSLAYSAADVFVNPSLQESFGKTIVEALYCGVPVVSTPVGVAPEIINDSNGVICKSRNSHDISEALSMVINHTYDRTSIRANAVNLFSPNDIANKYIELYNDVLE